MKKMGTITALEKEKRSDMQAHNWSIDLVNTKRSSKRLIPAWKGFFLKDEIQGNRSNSENNWK